MSGLFHQVLFLPLYNLLVWLSAALPGHQLGWAIIIITLLVRFILFPLQHRMSQTQIQLKKVEPAVQKIKQDYANDKAEQARRLMELYREHGINPWFGFLTLLIQLPVLLALFYVFRSGFNFQPEWLYSFVKAPAVLATTFLGLELTGHSYILAILVGISQWAQARLMTPTPTTSSANQGWSGDFQRSLQLQTKYVFPVIIVLVAINLPTAISLYWLVSNGFTLIHTWWISKKNRPH
jgi:YidC/Oxa1 family membrane protein insertase